MPYLPFARKYRPQMFADFLGQPHVATTLSRALESKRIGQAYLFAGPRGVGKTSAARILAKCVNCAKGPVATPCNTCSSCTQITQGNSLDVIEIDGASNRGIDEIRTLRDSVAYAPTSGSFRVYIIDEVHMLTTEAFNALLKTLEEPPAPVKFIFATPAATKVPATILSRCQRFDFRRIESKTIVDALQRIAKAEQVRIDEPALYAIARAADGSLRDGEVILEQMANFVDGAIKESDVTALLGSVESDVLIALMGAIIERDALRALSIVIDQLEQGKDAPQLLGGLLRHLRNLLILRTTTDSTSRDAAVARLVDESAERLKRLEEQATRSSPGELLMYLQIVTSAYELVRRSPMARIILELVIIKLATREQWQSLEQISQRLEQLSVGPSSQQVSEVLPARARGTAHAASGAISSPHAPIESAPSVTPASSPLVASDALSQTWSIFLERLAAQKMSLAAYLADAKPLQLEGNTLTVGLPGFALHQEVLTVVEHRRVIERLLAELCQHPVSVQYTTLPDAPASESSATGSSAATASMPPVVQDIVSLFNATLLDQPRTS